MRLCLHRFHTHQWRRYHLPIYLGRERCNLWLDEGKRHGSCVNPPKNFNPCNASSQESGHLNNHDVSVASSKAQLSPLPHCYGLVKFASSCPKLINFALAFSDFPSFRSKFGDREQFTFTKPEIPHSHLFPTAI